MDEPIKDATLEEKIDYINSNLKPLYQGRYEKSLLIEALAVMIDVFGKDETLNEADKTSKKFQVERMAEVEKQLARDAKLIKFFETKLEPLLKEQQSAQAQSSAEPVKESSPNGHVEKEHI